MSDLIDRDASDIISLLKAADITPHDCLDALESRIGETEPKVHALPTLCFDRARERADALMRQPLAQRGELAGLPVPIKDLTAVAGVRSTQGSRVFADNIPTKSDFLVQNLERAGAIVYAKSNTPEFGLGANSFNDLFETTRTPYNTHYSSAGSSGGAAASLAVGSAWLAHGSDMAGSLRTPASFCAVTSLRPSPGVFNSDTNNMPLAVLGQQGPMARNLTDLALLADAMTGVDLGNPTSKAFAAHAFFRAVRQPRAPTRVAISATLGGLDVDDSVQAVVQQVAETLARAGATVVEGCPDFTGAAFAFDTLRAFGLATQLGSVLDEIREQIKPEAVWNIEKGLSLSAGDVGRATREQGQTMARAAAFMADVDCLICPACQRASLPFDERYAGANSGVPIPEYYEWLRIACHTTTSALPVLSLPAGYTDRGEPVAVQVVGRPCGELELVAVGAALEHILNTARRPIDPRDSFHRP